MGSSYLSCSFSRSILPPTHHKFLNGYKIIDMWPGRNDIGNIFVRFRSNHCATIGFKRVSKPNFKEVQPLSHKVDPGPYPKTSNSDKSKITASQIFLLLKKLLKRSTWLRNDYVIGELQQNHVSLEYTVFLWPRKRYTAVRWFQSTLLCRFFYSQDE